MNIVLKIQFSEQNQETYGLFAAWLTLEGHIVSFDAPAPHMCLIEGKPLRALPIGGNLRMKIYRALWDEFTTWRMAKKEK